MCAHSCIMHKLSQQLVNMEIQSEIHLGLIYSLLVGMEKSTGNNDVLVGIITSSVTFALTTMVCFITGFICGHFSTNLTKCAKVSREESVNSNTTDYNIATNPVYEDIMPQEIRPPEKDPELEGNVAYKL